MATQTTPLVFLGATAFAEISEIVRDINLVKPTFNFQAILDDNSQLHGTAVEGVPVVGPLEMVDRFPDAQFVLGIGSYHTRLIRYQVVNRLKIPAERYATLISPRAKVFASTQIKSGVIIHAMTHIGNDSLIEDFALISPACVIGARNIVGEGALLAAGVHCTGDVAIGPYCHIGMSSMLGEYVGIGAGAQVGMGSLVLRNIPAGVFAFGNPQRYLSKLEVPAELLDHWRRIETDPRRRRKK